MPDYKPDEIDEILINLICRGACKFYKEGPHEKNLEKYQCGAYLGLKKMLKQGNITREKLEELLRDIKK